MATKQLFNTESGLQKLKEELEYLKGTKLTEVKNNLAVARSYGDLSENSEYDEAKREQAKVERRIAELEDIILHTTVIEDTSDPNVVHLGSTVVLKEKGSTKEKKYSIVGSNEADPEKHMISDRSPIGSQLINRHKGDEITVDTPKGTKIYKIKDVSKTAKV